MRIAIAADHNGFDLKQQLVTDLRASGHQVADLGADGTDGADDYPDFAQRVCEAIREGRAERAVVVCGSGVGITVAANKFPGIRAGMCHDLYSARQGVEHDDMNVLCLGSRVVTVDLARELVKEFLAARFSNEERHARRLSKVKAIEARFMKPGK